jgi:hypothetical protein
MAISLVKMAWLHEVSVQAHIGEADVKRSGHN